MVVPRQVRISDLGCDKNEAFLLYGIGVSKR